MESRGRPTTLIQLIHAIQESRATLQASSAILAQEEGAALKPRRTAEQDSELWDAGRWTRAEEMRRLRGVACSQKKSRQWHARLRRNAQR